MTLPCGKRPNLASLHGTLRGGRWDSCHVTKLWLNRMWEELLLRVSLPCFRGGLAGILNVQPWRAPSLASPWTSTVVGLICASPTTTTSWLSPRYEREGGLLTKPKVGKMRDVSPLFVFLTGFLWERLLGALLPAHWAPHHRRLQDVQVSEELHHHQRCLREEHRWLEKIQTHPVLPHKETATNP